MEVKVPNLQFVKITFMNFCSESANLALIVRLFHILAAREENAFCPCTVIFLGNLTSIFVL